MTTRFLQLENGASPLSQNETRLQTSMQGQLQDQCERTALLASRNVYHLTILRLLNTLAIPVEELIGLHEDEKN